MGLDCSVKLIAATLLLLGGIATAQSSATFIDGQKVEVREGDAWSKAEVKKKEGRKYLIHYEGADDASDEWVTPDRIRSTGGSSSAAAQTTAKPTPPGNAQFALGQKVEVKWGGTWYEATVQNKRGEWTIVIYSRGDKSREWVEPWRIRKLGSKDDPIGIASPNPRVRKDEGPPSEKPGPAPEPFGAAKHDDKDRAESLKSDPAYKQVNIRSAERLSLDPEGKYTPDVATLNPPAQPITLKGSRGQTFEKVAGITIAHGGKGFAAVAHEYAPPGKPGELRIERLDLATGKSDGVWPVTPKTELVDISPDGKSVLLRSNDFGIGKKDRLELWSLDGKDAKKTSIFLPYGDKDWTGRNVDFAAFADPAHVLTISNDGTLVLWDAATAKAVYTAPTNKGSRPAISATGKYLAVEKGKGVVILEAATGKGVLVLDGAGTALSYSFSPTGKQLAGWSGKSAKVWDLENGKLYRDFTTYLQGFRLQIISDGYALLDSKYLIDFERRIPLVKYDGIATPSDAAVGEVWFATTDPVRELPIAKHVPLPDAQARSAAKSINPDDVLLLKPGTKVSLILNISADDKERAEVEKALRATIAAKGYTVADDQPLKIVATTETGKTTEREYRLMGPGSFGRIEKATITEQKARLSVELDGKSIWQSESTRSPGHVIMDIKPGQSLQDAINEDSKPNTPFLKSADVPAYLTKPHDPAWYAESKLSK